MKRTVVASRGPAGVRRSGSFCLGQLLPAARQRQSREKGYGAGGGWSVRHFEEDGSEERL